MKCWGQFVGVGCYYFHHHHHHFHFSVPAPFSGSFYSCGGRESPALPQASLAERKHASPSGCSRSSRVGSDWRTSPPLSPWLWLMAWPGPHPHGHTHTRTCTCTPRPNHWPRAQAWSLGAHAHPCHHWACRRLGLRVCSTLNPSWWLCLSGPGAHAHPKATLVAEGT